MTRKEFKKLIANNRIKEAIQWLQDAMEKIDDPELGDQILLISALFHKYLDEEKKGTVFPDNLSVNWAKILELLTHIEKDLPETIFAPPTASVIQEFNTHVRKKKLTFFRLFLILLLLGGACTWIFFHYFSRNAALSLQIGVDCKGKPIMAGKGEEISVDQFLESWQQLRQSNTSSESLEVAFSILCAQNENSLSHELILSNRTKLYILQTKLMEKSEKEVLEIFQED